MQGAIRSAAGRRVRQFYARDPRAEQRKLFGELIAMAAMTQFGKDYGFSRLAGLPFEQGYAAYRDRVPIRTYHDFWNDYFAETGSLSPSGTQRIDLHNTTWPGRISLFCETSGTTAPSKFIPFSRQMFAANRQAALDLISCYLEKHPRSAIPGGKVLYMSGSTALNDMGRGVYSGDMSAITLRFRPWYLAGFVEPSAILSSLPWEEKLQGMAELLLSDPQIRVISGVPPWIILLLRRCRDLSGKTLRQILPQLELIIHGGTSLKPYRAEFDELFDDNLPSMLEVFPSSEAFMGFQCAGDADMRLTPFYGAFFEFVRFEELDERGRPAPHAVAIPLEQVVTGQRYAIILSTCAGLWRYHIGDTIRFTSLSPHLIEFTGRDRFLDKLEEKVTQEEVERVVSELNRSADCAIREFMVASDIPGRRHVWFVAGTSVHDREQLAVQVDLKLRGFNADYATFREQGRIAVPNVVILPADVIYDWSQAERNKLGGQSKIPHIDPTPDGSLAASLGEYYSKTYLHHPANPHFNIR
ncbi:MAG: GH3 auxin-responsive promoter family protein [Desulfuromonadales bacterium]|nr:GH3 auxin-responsive promoter family protein [Desulfuromonadales bacterium]